VTILLLVATDRQKGIRYNEHRRNQGRIRLGRQPRGLSGALTVAGTRAHARESLRQIASQDQIIRARLDAIEAAIQTREVQQRIHSVVHFVTSAGTSFEQDCQFFFEHYGGELVWSVLGVVDEREQTELTKRLRGRGIPLVVVVALPIVGYSGSLLDDLSKALVGKWLKEEIEHQPFTGPPGWSERPIPSSLILDVVDLATFRAKTIAAK